jgi:hypothetical protein
MSALPRSIWKPLGRLILILLVVGGVVWWERNRPLDVSVSFDVPPVIPSGAASFPRELLSELHAELRDQEGGHVGRVGLGFARGLEGPLTHATSMALRRGTYTISARLTASDGRISVRHAVLRIDAAGPVRVSLD